LMAVDVKERSGKTPTAMTRVGEYNGRGRQIGKHQRVCVEHLELYAYQGTRSVH